MNQSCPIVYDKVNDKITRINSGIIFMGLVIFVATPFKWIIIPIVVDFFIRVIFGSKNSPVCFMIKLFLNAINSEPHMVNAGPKKFAAKIGLTLTSVILILYLMNFDIVSLVIGIISVIAVGLEVFFNYCVACKIYSVLTNMGIKL